MHTKNNPCYNAIYHATRNITRRKPQNVETSAPTSLATLVKAQLEEEDKAEDSSDLVYDATAQFNSPPSTSAVAPEKTLSDADQDPQAQASGPVQPAAAIPGAAPNPDSDYEDCSAFMDQEFWNKAIKMRREMKRLTKELNAVSKALDDHLGQITKKFEFKEKHYDE